MTTEIPTTFINRNFENLEKWRQKLSADQRLLVFAENSRRTEMAVRSGENLLRHLEGVASRDPAAMRAFRNRLVGPARSAPRARQPHAHAADREGGRRRGKTPCRLLNVEGLVAVHAAAALVYGGQKEWSQVRENLQTLSISTMEVHWQIHLADNWDSERLINGEVREALVRELANDHRPLGAPPGADEFFGCSWYRDRVIEELLRFADTIADIQATLPKCLDGTYSNDQIDDVSPEVVCSLEVIRLTGSFPPVQDPAVTVLFPTSNGYRDAEIVSWGAESIEIRVPVNAVPGCIWFADQRKRQEYLECVRAEAIQQPVRIETIRVLDVQLKNYPFVNSVIQWFFANKVVNPDDLPCFPESAAYFRGSSVEVRDLMINGRQAMVFDWNLGQFGSVLVDSWIGQSINLRFAAIAAEHLHLCAWTSEYGYTFHTELDPTASSYQLIVPTLPSGTELSVRVFGWNRCSDQVPLLAPLDQSDPCSAAFGTSGMIPVVESVEGRVRLRVQPQLSILGVEVTQAVQRFSVTAPEATSNNSVGLIRGRTTVFRVYVDSGIAGSGSLARVPVVGTLQLPDASAIQSWGTGWARPQAEINREITSHALTFVVPGALLRRSSCFISIYVRVPDAPTTENFSAQRGVTVVLNPGGSFAVMGILYDNPRRNLFTTDQDLFDAMDELTRMMPVADDAVSLWVPANARDAHQDMQSDLTTKAGWNKLLGRLEDLAEGYEDEGEYWMGVVPDSDVYALNGKAMARTWITYPKCLTQAITETPAHEMAHLFEIHHADCREPGGSDPCATTWGFGGCDSTLKAKIPNGRTEDVGFDVLGARWSDGRGGAIRAGVGDLMSYCSSERRWPSIALWELLRSKIG